MNPSATRRGERGKGKKERCRDTDRHTDTQTHRHTDRREGKEKKMQPVRDVLPSKESRFWLLASGWMQMQFFLALLFLFWPFDIIQNGRHGCWLRARSNVQST